MFTVLSAVKKLQNLKMKKPAKLRVCASCEWIFDKGIECPKCGFGSYGAYYVYGNKAYTYKKTQHPWLEKKLFNYKQKLLNEIKKNEPEIISKGFLSIMLRDFNTFIGEQNG
jgi:hypothetical protein